MRSLEDKLRALAAKGELVHLSLAYTHNTFECVYTAASPAGGHAIGTSNDPVEAVEAALKASPVKTRASKVTATVTEPDEPKASLPSDWTMP